MIPALSGGKHAVQPGDELTQKQMGEIRQACIDKWGEVPHLDTYRQMAIRQDKAGDHRQALWWAERGLSIYGSDCARPEDVEDLRKRAARYRTKLGLSPPASPDQ